MSNLPAHLASLTKFELAFVEHLAAGHTLADAAVLAGYADYRAAYRAIARERVAQAVLVECQAKEAMHAGEMLDIQLKLARTAKKEEVRDRASARLLERASPSVNKSEVKHTHSLADIPLEELRARRLTLQRKLGIPLAPQDLESLPAPEEAPIDVDCSPVAESPNLPSSKEQQAEVEKQLRVLGITPEEAGIEFSEPDPGQAEHTSESQADNGDDENG